MSYYNKNYYPTPPAVIDIMLEGLDLKGKSILDPSAGMGALLDAVKYRCKKTFAIEIENDFQTILKEKKHTVLHTDFLTYSGTHAFDFILMNPPFDNGVKHCLKAIEILKPGCTLVCLLNWETINNPYTEDRSRLLKEIELVGGSITNLGSCFSSSERKTNVEVGMVKLTKPTKQQSKSFEFDGISGTNLNDKLDINSSANELERYDKITAYCRAYQKAVDQLTEMYAAIKELEMFMSPFVNEYTFREMVKKLTESLTGKLTVASTTEVHNEFVMEFQSRAWAKIFSDSRVTGLMTEKVKQDFDKKREAMGGFDLNPDNVMLAFGAIFNQKQDIEAACIKEAFEWLTYYSEKNRQYFGETWKTNSHYMVGSKLILPLTDSYGSVSYRQMDKLNDLERALCLVTGKIFGPEYEDPTKNKDEIPVNIVKSSSVIRNCYQYGLINDKIESEFFHIKLYLKGTAHFTFKDDNVRMMFNRAACEALGWQLPENETFNKKNKRK